MLRSLIAHYGPALPAIYLHPEVCGMQTGKQRESWKSEVLEVKLIGLNSEFFKAKKPPGITYQLCLMITPASSWVSENTKDKKYLTSPWHVWVFIRTSDHPPPLGQDVYIYDDWADHAVVRKGQYRDLLYGPQQNAIQGMVENKLSLRDVKIGGNYGVAPGQCVQDTVNWLQGFLLAAANAPTIPLATHLQNSQTWYLVDYDRKNPATLAAYAAARAARPPPPPPTVKTTRSAVDQPLPEIGAPGSVFLPRRTYQPRKQPGEEGEEGEAGEGAGGGKADPKGKGKGKAVEEPEEWEQDWEDEPLPVEQDDSDDEDYHE